MPKPIRSTTAAATSAARDDAIDVTDALDTLAELGDFMHAAFVIAEKVEGELGGALRAVILAARLSHGDVVADLESSAELAA